MISQKEHKVQGQVVKLPRKIYSAPKVVEWGSIGEITQGGHTPGSDLPSGSGIYGTAPVRPKPLA